MRPRSVGCSPPCAQDSARQLEADVLVPSRKCSRQRWGLVRVRGAGGGAGVLRTARCAHGTLEAAGRFPASSEWKKVPSAVLTVSRK